jgi:hypothetical protein
MSSHALATLAGALGAGSVAEAQQVYVAGKGVGATQAGADEFGRLVTACKSTGSEKERRVLMGAIASDAGVDPDQLSEMVGSPRRGRILPFGDFVGSLPIGMLTGAVGRRATGGEMEAAAGAALRSAGVTVSVSAPPIRAQGASGAGSAPASRAEDPYEKIFDKISPNPTDEELRGLIIAVNAVKSTRPMPLPQGFEKLKALQNAITTALKDSSADLRLAAVNVMEKLAVARFGGRWMVGLLAKAMFDPDEGVRDAAQRVIETKIGVYADYGDVLSDLQQDNRF